MQSQDEFIEGFHDIPSQDKLAALSFVELAALFSECKTGAAKYTVVERELDRRKQSQQEKAKSDAEPAPDHWYKKPIGVIGIAITSGVLVYLAVSLLK